MEVCLYYPIHLHGVDRENITFKDGDTKEVVPVEFNAKGLFCKVECYKLPSDCTFGVGETERYVLLV